MTAAPTSGPRSRRKVRPMSGSPAMGELSAARARNLGARKRHGPAGLRARGVFGSGGRRRRRTGADAVAEADPAALEARPGLLAGGVAAAERVDLRVGDALIELGCALAERGPAVLNRRIPRGIALRDGGEELRQLRLHAILAVGAANFHARMVPVVTGVLLHLEVLDAGALACPVVLLRLGPARGDVDRRRVRVGGRTRRRACPEVAAARLQRGARALAGVVTTLEGDDLRLIDALVELR